MSVNGSPVLRFAPSPNGYLHVGHARSAILNARTARRLGGRLLLRIEDIDLSRRRPEFETAIFQDLGWLGIAFETPARRQSAHFADYTAALDGLVAQGLAYPCFCTRGDIARAVAQRPGWRRDPDGAPLYPGLCRGLSAEEIARRKAAGEAFALRLDMRAAPARLKAPLTWREFGEGDTAHVEPAAPERWGDAVLRRKDIPASYHIAVVVDDALQGVTDVVRGMDLFAATGLHRMLQVLLELPEPNYRHHALLLGADGRKLSKSEGARSLRALRAAGVSVAEVYRLAGLDGFVPSPGSRREGD
jgi:glutamyl-Q tRNA(Asp) synthetase